MVVERAPAPPVPDGVESAQQLTSLMSMVSTVQPEFDRLARELAHSGLTALPSADGVGLAVLEEGRLRYLAETDDFVAAVDNVQYAAVQGPCVTAALEHRTVVASLLDDDAWPELTAQARAVGVRSALSIPLTIEDRLIGTLNVYAHPASAFDQEDAALGEEFAASAAGSLQRALVLQRSHRAAQRLGGALAVRRTVHRAVGLLMAQDGVEAAEAHAQLVDTAAAAEQDLAAAAQELWDQRVGHASMAETDASLAARWV